MYSFCSLRGKLTYLSAALLGLLLATPAAAQAPFDPPGLDRAIAAQEFHTDGLLEIDGVVGVGVGLTARGQAAIVIMTEDLWVTGFPRSLDGVPVVVKVTGRIYAINKPDESGNHNHGDDTTTKIDPTSKFAWPVPIGVSTGNFKSCSAGTIGARVTDGTNVYALSNNHVYALENTATADNPATDNVDEGDVIVQPGVYDTDCTPDTANEIGTLVAYVPIVFDGSTPNAVDAAIALSDTAKLGFATPSDGYGIPSSATVDAYAGLSVQKYGRTTGLTKGTVAVTNTTVKVRYNSGIARFVHQIVVDGDKGGFLRAGDSGSLLVTDSNGCGIPGDPCDSVGLLFAGASGGKTAIANRIDLVLDALEGIPHDGVTTLEGIALVPADIDDGT